MARRCSPPARSRPSTRPPSGARSPTGTCQGSTSSYSRRAPSPGRSATGMPAGPGSIRWAPILPSTSRRPAISPARRCAPWPKAAIPAARSGRRPQTPSRRSRGSSSSDTAAGRIGRNRGGDATAARAECPAALAWPAGPRHHPPRHPRCARPRRRCRQADHREPHPGGGAEDVQLGGRPRHHPRFPLRRREAADSRTSPRPGADRRELRNVWMAAGKIGGPFGALVQSAGIDGAAPRRSRQD